MPPMKAFSITLEILFSAGWQIKDATTRSNAYRKTE